jgi:hypothetical protein
MQRIEYKQARYIDRPHQNQKAVDVLNELGKEGWRPAFSVGRYLILWRERVEATIEDWRNIYAEVDEETRAALDGDAVAALVEKAGFAPPSRATLNRWAGEARGKVDAEG